jgi:hypothetical protein
MNIKQSLLMDGIITFAEGEVFAAVDQSKILSSNTEHKSSWWSHKIQSHIVATRSSNTFTDTSVEIEAGITWSTVIGITPENFDMLPGDAKHVSKLVPAALDWTIDGRTRLLNQLNIDRTETSEDSSG